MRPQEPPTRAPTIGPLLREVRRRTAIIVLRENREWTLADLDAEMRGAGPYAKWLARITVAELVHAETGPPVRLTLAKEISGPEFDAMVHAVLLEARRFVGARYLRARVGGPRWKLQHALGRLVRDGRAERKGKTSDAVYKGVQ